ncbi:tRNA (adenosine(37)-N6)-threonylcarbamoyltransferase complex ATPase subunit type 1 TsaE [Terrihabitans rhizophilus]|uniref:tRNA threonylcarbamoyladenosine biosynthesis protein TsaE n=1 Tax=Terrihabitans rhizophilus TaxID=3092662 RepID=A0ABU4RIH0_9HYPH|nr:tRNA (adenosine(37)-N6)-threonylcarbamoyltransferase complex ATPase subunit type 1 TsaE [Terrihabitans sp. PJ23]MDX6804612.1 tRNA (adenosine(37)-N6)-threonylcarbamoyltransferase complex ATPase subunit type 1 TsaE [Terrihabitans sp. PJ23]
MASTSDTATALALPDEAATTRLAAALAPLLKPGDVVALAGDLGSGKTTFARQVIRRIAGDPELDVPSPTFSLIQTYDTPRGTVLHADLYRVADPEELLEIGWDEVGGGVIALVEWPERAGSDLASGALRLTFSIDPERPSDSRRVEIGASDDWMKRIERGLQVAAFLDEAGWGTAQRLYLQGDASSRRYERLVTGTSSAILMDAPARPDGPAIRDGKPYSRLAHLAEDVVPFIAVAGALREAGFSAPQVLSADAPAGLLLTEDFGGETVLVGGAHTAERLTVAADVLVELHGRERSSQIPYGDGSYTIPDYDLDALLIETELLADWYIPAAGAPLGAADRARFLQLWRDTLDAVQGSQATWVLRDYHSPNLMWLPEREGIRRIGLLDFQDAVMGHPAYDLVSLLQDARVDVPEALEMQLLSRYVGARKKAPQVFDPNDFARAYATLGAQRATKILGIFVRLAVRDGKRGYLRHLPRMLGYLRRNLAHPSLEELRGWYVDALGSLEAAPPL